MAQATKKTPRAKEPQTKFLSSATKSMLENAKKSKELLLRSSEDYQDISKDVHSWNPNGNDPVDEEQKKTLEEEDDEDDNQWRMHNDKDITKESLNATGYSDQSVETNTNGPNYISDSSNASKNNAKITNPYQWNKNLAVSSTEAKSQWSSTVKPSSTPGLIDKQIALKRGMLRNQVHRYTLRIEIISSKSEEDKQFLIQKTLQNFFDIVLHGDIKWIIPPYFELERSDTLVPHLSSTFNVEASGSYYSMKRYFSRLSPRSAEGFV
jgi:hypothetical protein